MTSPILGALLAVSLLPLPQTANDAAADLTAGLRQFEEGNLQAAVVTFDGVIRSFGNDPMHRTDLAMAHLYMGAACLGLHQNERAEAEMRKAAQLDPGLVPDPQRLPAAAVALFQRVKGGTKSSKKTVPLIVAGGAAVAGGIAVAASGGKSATSEPTVPVVTIPPTAPAPPPTPPPTTVPSGPQASAFGIYLVGAGTSERHEVQVGAGTLVARYEGFGSEVQVIVNDPTGTNVAVDTNFKDQCNSDKLMAEARAQVTAGTYAVIVKVGRNKPSICCREPNCVCKNIPDCFFANGQISIFYPGP
jgi:hypothetical protein